MAPFVSGMVIGQQVSGDLFRAVGVSESGIGDDQDRTRRVTQQRVGGGAEDPLFEMLARVRSDDDQIGADLGAAIEDGAGSAALGEVRVRQEGEIERRSKRRQPVCCARPQVFTELGELTVAGEQLVAGAGLVPDVDQLERAARRDQLSGEPRRHA